MAVKHEHQNCNSQVPGEGPKQDAIAYVRLLVQEWGRVGRMAMDSRAQRVHLDATSVAARAQARNLPGKARRRIYLVYTLKIFWAVTN